MPVSDTRLNVLEQLGDEFSQLGPPRRLGAGPTPRAMLLAAVLVLLLAGAATAAIVITRGGSLPGANPQDLAANGIPLAGSSHLAGLDAPDPDEAEPPWDIRLSRTSA
jgi:hypothetical protein